MNIHQAFIKRYKLEKHVLILVKNIKNNSILILINPHVTYKFNQM
jgi:hypothetical protein